MLALYVWLKTWLNAEEGQDLIEYAMIIVLVVIVAIVGLGAVGTKIQGIWSTIVTALGS